MTLFMPKTPLLKPFRSRKFSAAEVRRWYRHRSSWLATIDPQWHFQRLFEHIPGVHFFAKDRNGRLMFATRGLLERYRMADDSEFVGRTDFDINPENMAASYVRDDRLLLAGRAKIVERIELWGESQGTPEWYLVTKLPLRGRDGKIAGVMGILRHPGHADQQLPVYQTVARAVEIIRGSVAEPLVVADVAKRCGQSLRQLQRRFQEAFGLSPKEFILRTRIQVAQRLLTETSLTTSEISRRCGFADVSGFTQHFRRRTGLTPAKYRRERR
jgi:AraC-like DNA-binding protein